MSRRVILGKAKGGSGPSGEGFIMQIETTSANQSFTLPSRSGYTYDYTVYWGDGSSDSYTVATQPSHTYTVAGTYDIEIEGRFDAMYFNDVGSKLLVKKILSWGGTQFDGFTAMDNAFMGCSNLNELAEGGIKERSGSPITYCNYSFYSCSSLTTLPADLFRYTTSATIFSFCFFSCSSLTTLPADLFRYTTSVTSFGACFRNCSSLTMRSDIFGTDTANRFLNKSVNFIDFFEVTSFTGTQGTAPELWNFNFGTGTPSTADAFKGHSTTSLSNWDDVPANWRD